MTGLKQQNWVRRWNNMMASLVVIWEEFSKEVTVKQDVNDETEIDRGCLGEQHVQRSWGRNELGELVIAHVKVLRWEWAWWVLDTAHADPGGGIWLVNWKPTKQPLQWIELGEGVYQQGQSMKGRGRALDLGHPPRLGSLKVVSPGLATSLVVWGVAQSRTRLKWLSSSSSSRH